jgi:hypothetical protein
MTMEHKQDHNDFVYQAELNSLLINIYDDSISTHFKSNPLQILFQNLAPKSDDLYFIPELSEEAQQQLIIEVQKRGFDMTVNDIESIVFDGKSICDGNYYVRSVTIRLK